MGQQSSPEAHRIARLFEQAFEGQPYYGPAIFAVLDRVTAPTGSLRTRGSHSIWELVAHITAEINYASAVLDGHVAPWVEGVTTWPRITDVTDAAWHHATDDLRAAYRKLVDRVGALDDATLSQRELMPVERSIYEMLHGTLQHTIYHAGQIVLLVKSAQ